MQEVQGIEVEMLDEAGVQQRAQPVKAVELDCMGGMLF